LSATFYNWQLGGAWPRPGAQSG